MNKYKMITICSLSIVCILILSLLLPLTTSANDEESIELKMHYESSKVTVNIAVNSEVYTGVVCKYIEVDNVLTSDNLSDQTQKTGTTLNLNKTEDDKYVTTIENVSKRYVVIYVSIGNCDICDYIDCNLNNSEVTSNNTSEDNNQETEENVNSKDNQDAEMEENKNENENTDAKKQNISNQSSKDENTEVENTENQENTNKATENSNNSDNESDDNKMVVESNNVVETTDDFQTIDETSTNTKENQTTQTTTTQKEEKNENKDSKTQTTNQKQEQNQSSIAKSDNTNSKSESNSKQQTSNNTNSQIDLQNLNKDTINVTDKDSINTDEFEEIESVDKTISTADTKMPQTGENDSIKIIGIVIFSMISVASFYKYKKTK